MHVKRAIRKVSVTKATICSFRSTRTVVSMLTSGKRIRPPAVCGTSAVREDARIGRLRRKPGGQWYFDYAEGERDDEIGFHLGEERFVTGEYVSIGRNGVMHTYQVARVEKP